MSLVVKGGTAFVGGKFAKRDILIEDGVITGIAPDLPGDERINASGLFVLPGLIDPHVHLREPGDTYKEDFATGSRAAIAGGFTTVIDMPNNAVPTTTKKRLDEKIALAKKKAVCDVLFHFGGTDDNFDEVKAADPQSLKLYLGKTTGELMLKEPFSMEKHFLGFPHDRPIVLHACHHSDDEKENLEQTYAMEERAVDLAEAKDRRIHIAHASTAKEVRIAKRYGKCTVEVAPHHLFLSTKAREMLGYFAKVYPPLRSEQKRLMLWRVLELADCIATDHAPHTSEDKEAGAAGFPGLETSVGLMLTACSRGLLDRIWVTESMSSRPADIFGIKGKGRIEKGFAGDLTIVDLRKEWVVNSSIFETKCKWSPFEGMKLKGRVHTVVKGGKVLCQDFRMLV